MANNGAYSAPGGLPGQQRTQLNIPQQPALTADQKFDKMVAALQALQARLAPEQLKQDIIFTNLAVGGTKNTPINQGTMINAFLCTLTAGSIEVYFNVDPGQYAGVQPDLRFDAAASSSEEIFLPSAQYSNILVVSTDLSSGASGKLILISY